MSQFPVLENQIRQQYRLFKHKGFWSQLHAQDPKENRLVSRELVQGEDSVVEWARSFNSKGNLYLGRAARSADGTPVSCGAFTVDIDPVRVKGTASTPELHAKAIAVGRGVLNGLGEGYLCSSGNGALIIVPFDSAVETDLARFAAQCKQFEEQLRALFQDSEVTIDATQDTARLARLLGTVNTKGPRESWRYARIIRKPLFRTVRSSIRKSIEAIPVHSSIVPEIRPTRTDTLENALPQVPTLPTYDHSVYPTRERAEFAFALRLKLAGFGAEDIRKQLAQYGYIQNPRDAQRVIEKLFAGTGTFNGGAAAIQRIPSGEGRISGRDESAMLPAEPLWTPADSAQLLSESMSGRSSGQGVGTGFKFLDNKLGGFRPGYVYAVEAPTNVGKSTYITQIANHLARCGRRVLLVITEMDVQEAVTRIKALGTGIPGHCLETDALSGDQRSALKVFEEGFGKYSLFIRYTTSPNQAAIEKDIQESKAEVVLWDYYQHFETGTDNRQVQLASLARWYESMALKYQIPFVVAAQLHRRVDFKTNKVMPSTMDQIKDCKVLNDAAKVVITLDWQHGEHEDDGPVPVLMDIAKNKGPQGKGVVRLNRQVPRFEEL